MVRPPLSKEFVVTARVAGRFDSTSLLVCADAELRAAGTYHCELSVPGVGVGCTSRLDRPLLLPDRRQPPTCSRSFFAITPGGVAQTQALDIAKLRGPRRGR